VATNSEQAVSIVQLTKQQDLTACIIQQSHSSCINVITAAKQSLQCWYAAATAARAVIDAVLLLLLHILLSFAQIMLVAPCLRNLVLRASFT
jgi:hypothetical protein